MSTVAMVCVCLLVAVVAMAEPPSAAVEVEEDVYTYVPADNGSGPMWCHGSTCIVRVGDNVFATGLETIPDLKPLNNVRWTFWTRDAAGWRLIRTDDQHRTREPAPMGTYEGGPAFISVNPTLADPDVYSGPAQPQILQVDVADPEAEPATLLPEWDGEPEFTEHSYRSFAADGPDRELILFQNIGYTHAEWAFRGSDGAWAAHGQLVWPYGAEYDTPQPIRVCYPTVALKDGAVHFCGVSDIVEPYNQWRDYKKELTGREWDYDFRRLFYTYTPDITATGFTEWVEVASRDKTAGWIFPCDLWVAPDGAAHILWTERAIDERLREKFFPEAKQRYQLNYAIVRDGEVALKMTLQEGGEGLASETPGNGRFHITADGRLLVVYFISGSRPDGAAFAEDRLLEIYPDGTISSPTVLDIENPFSSFFTATPRGGSSPSDLLDLFGECRNTSNTMRYARLRIGPAAD